MSKKSGPKSRRVSDKQIKRIRGGVKVRTGIKAGYDPENKKEIIGHAK